MVLSGILLATAWGARRSLLDAFRRQLDDRGDQSLLLIQHPALGSSYDRSICDRRARSRSEQKGIDERPT